MNTFSGIIKGSDNSRRQAAIWAAGVHVVILVICLLIRYTLPATPLPEEMGMEVNLGTDADGSGTDQPMDMRAPAAAALRSISGATADAGSNDADPETSNDADAPSVAVNPNKSRNNRPTPVQQPNSRPATTQQPAANTATAAPKPKYVFEGATGEGGNSATADKPGTGEGNTTGNGDRGVPGGTPGAANYTGTPGPGRGGVSYQFTNRRIAPASFEADFNKGGTVKVRVSVDRSGNITIVNVVSSTDGRLTDLALEKLRRAKFAPSSSAQPEEKGIVTIVFKTRG